MCLRSVIYPTTGLSPYEIVFGKSINTEKGINFNFSFKDLTNKQLNKLVKQCGYQLESDPLQEKDIFPGDKVMIRVLPKEKSILKARYEGPFEHGLLDACLPGLEAKFSFLPKGGYY